MAKKKEPTLAEEAGLPESWHPVDIPPLTPGQPLRSNAMGNYFAGSISPDMLQSNAGLRDTQYGSPLIPKLPLMPMPLAGKPSVGSAIQSGSTTTINTNVNVVAAGPNGAVQFNSGGALAGNIAFIFNSGTTTLTIVAGTNITGSVTITGSLVITGNASAVIFNAGTGFQIGGAAASGKYLRGNGTNFVSATLSGSDILTGLVGVTFGGTGANLSATGGVSQVVQQSSVGGTFTVSQLAASDLTNGTTGSGAVVLATTPTINGLTFPTAAGSAVVAQLVASGTATLGTTLIGPTSSASVVTVAATGVVATDSIEWAFNAAPGTGYASGLFVQVYVTSGNVNFLVTNPTAGNLTPAAATLNWRVIR